MKALNFQLLVDGTDLTDYVVSSERNHSMCNPLATLDITLAPDLPIAVSPYQEIVFYEDGDKVFTGYSQEDIAARLPVEVSMRCNDILIRAQDSWFTGPLVADGESAVAWIKNFLNRAGIRKISVEVSENYSIYPGYGWEYSTCWAAITTCMQQSPYQVFADREGVVHIKQTKRGAADYTINEYVGYDRVTNDSWIRNRAVVYGNGFVTDKQEASVYLLPGEVRAAIVATGQIHWASTADAIASNMLSEFREPLDIKIIELEGNPDYEVTQIVDFTDPETGYHKSDCMITGVSTVMNAEDGYITEITLDEKCVSFWGWDVEPPPPLPKIYTGMNDSGVYRSDWDSFVPSVNWGTYNDGLSGSALTVYDIKISSFNTLWITTAGGVYKRPKDTDTWQRVALPEPEVGMGEPDVSTILCSKCWICDALHENTVYVLAHKASENKVWLYKTINDGLAWIWLELSEEDVTWAALPDFWAGNDPRVTKFRNGNLYSGGYAWPQANVRRYDGANWHDLIAGNRPTSFYDMVISSGDILYATGSFKLFNPGGTPPRVGYWNGVTWQALGNPAANTNFQLYAVALYGTNVIVGGLENTTIEGVPIDCLAIWNGANWAEFAGGASGGIVYSIAVHDTFVYVADITTVGLNTSPLSVNEIACWDGNIWSDMLGGVTGGVINSMVIGPKGELYVAGSFTQAGNVPVNYIAKWYNGNWHALGDGLPSTFDRSTMTVKSNGHLYIGCEGYVRVWDGTGWEVLPGNITDWAADDNFHVVLDEDNDLIYASGDINRVDGNPFVGYHLVGTTTYLPLHIPDKGRTHLLDADADDGEFIYAAALSNANHPVILRIGSDLDEDENPRISYRQGVGTWGGVTADLYIPGAIWIHGDFGPYKIRLSENYGYYPYEDKTDAGWGGGEVVRALVPSFSPAADYIAILNVAEEAWKTQDDGATWSKTADLTFPANFGRDLLDGMGVMIGDEGGDADILRYSKRNGVTWTEQSTGIPAGKRMANVLEEIEYV